ncbi:MAG: SLBB domain-containing protein [Bacteroidales bacterium]
MEIELLDVTFVPKVNHNKMLRRLLVLIFISLIFCEVQAQMPSNFKNVDISALTDMQIRQIRNQIQKQGLTNAEAMEFAKARGANELQIAQLMSRIDALSTEQSTFMTEATEKEVEKDTLKLSEKEELEVDFNVFGTSFFNRKGLSFQPNLNAAVSPSYVLGIGDQLTINIWGISEQTYTTTVGRNGNIVIPRIGLLMVKGKTLAAVEKSVVARLSSVYSDLNSPNPDTYASVTLSKVRSININIIGDVYLPGTYTLSGATSLFNALYNSGGPNADGSFRKIKVIRNGEQVGEFDVYDYIVNGNTDVNIALEDNDLILVPPHLNQVKVGGEFQKTGMFELKDGETVENLLNYASGFSSVADNSLVTVDRLGNDGRLIKSVESELFDSFILKAGDSISCSEAIARYQNRVIIDGAVYRPGTYELTDNLTLKELIEKAKGVTEEAFMGRVMVSRLNKDFTKKNVSMNLKKVLSGENDIPLLREDSIKVYSIFELEEKKVVSIYGEVQEPITIDYREGLSLMDVITSAGGLKESASESFAEVYRRLSHEEDEEVSDNMGHVYSFAINRKLELDDTADEFVLQAFDRVFIKKSPSFDEGAMVSLTGEIKYPGVYSLKSKKERVSDLLERAGGLTEYSHMDGAMILRKDWGTPKQERLAEDMAKSGDSLAIELSQYNEISIDLAKAVNNPTCKENIYLEDGDEIIVPKFNAIVSVHGAVLSPSASLFEGDNLKKYINKSGGFDISAMRKKTYIVYPNGDAASTKSFLGIRNYPKVMAGAKIYVPEKPLVRDRVSLTEILGITGAFASLTMSIVSIMVLINQNK